MRLGKINQKYYINVKEIMKLKKPSKKSKLPKPKLKPTIIVDRDGEWLPIITW